ncbi:MAG: HAMP domain-containing histidine kinase [Spirochaetales bacterium]|nr:HAMP domain-containing histidine kinase [Spirochaetales bacterium]
MKIRNSFLLIMINIILVPGLILLIFFITDQNLFEDMNRPMKTLMDTFFGVSKKPPDQKSLELLPNSINIYKLDENLIFIDNPKFNSFSEYTKDIEINENFQFELVYYPEPTPLYMLFEISRSNIIQFYRFTLFKMRVGFLFLLLLLTMIITFIKARRLNKSILELEKATKNIAEGNLDFSINTKPKFELGSLTKSFEKMRVALKGEYEKRARFFMGISHDLKTPLSLISGYAEALLDGMAGTESSRTAYLEIIKSRASKLEYLIDHLIEYVKLETEEWFLSLQKSNLKEFLSNLCHTLKEDALLLHRQFEYHIDIESTIYIPMDTTMLNRVFENIFSNAVNSTQEQGIIRFSAFKDKNNIFLEFVDNGKGICPEDIDKIFEPFYRVTKSRGGNGFGLGLSVVKTILENHGFSISVKSEINRGASFIIQIPNGIHTYQSTDG